MTRSLIISLLLFFSLSVVAQRNEIVGVPHTGAMGITVSVAELSARSAQADLLPKTIRVREEYETRRHPRFPANTSTNTPVAPNSPNGISTTQAIYSNFLSNTLNESGSVPPDSQGDIGSTQVCIASNGRLKFYAKNTVCQTAQTTTTGTSNVTLASPAFSTDLNVFFATVAPNGTSDPHVRFDRSTGRWFIVAIDLASFSNACVIAVSSGATVTSAANFTFFSFVFDALSPVPPSPYAGGFFDYPTLGVDANALYIGGTMFDAAGTSYLGASVFIVRKSSILGAGPIVTTAFHQLGGAATGIYVAQGVDNDDPSDTVGYLIGVDAGVYSKLNLHRITNPGGTPVASAAVAISVAEGTSGPISQAAIGGNTVDVTDDRLYAASIRKNKITGTSSLWTAHAINVTSAGVASASGTRNAARWYQIDNYTGTPTLTQKGTLYDAAATNARGFIFPSIAMTGQGHAVLGFTTAAANLYLDAGVAGRYRTDAASTMQAFTLATAASTTYNPSFDPGPGSRWGDYSQTVVDPNDDMTMWSFQEYCNASNSWGVRAIQLKAPAPATPTAPGTIGCGSIVGPNYVTPITLNGTSVNNSEFFDPGTGYTNRLAVTTTGAGASISNLVFVSPTQITFSLTWPPSLAGTTQTLTITNPDCQSITTTYTLPNGCTPIPVQWISFTGRENNKKVLLNWATANEISNKLFVIEKSDNGLNGFAEIGTVNSHGINGGNYEFTDIRPSTFNYYRLKQVDFSGGFKYSETVLVKLQSKFNFAIYPNPASQNITVEYNERFQNGQISIVNSVGKTLMMQTLTAPNKIQIDINNLKAGLYIVKIVAADGSSLQEKLIVEAK